MRPHNLSGPPYQFLFTINEGLKEDLESNDGRPRGVGGSKGSRAWSLGRDVELGLADLCPTDMFGCSGSTDLCLFQDLEDLAGAVDDGVASVLYRWPNVGRYVAYFL
ncbi:hypothetical protein U1Q18_000988 [Sarracenia purpurea var. burkii]